MPTLVTNGVANIKSIAIDDTDVYIGVSENAPFPACSKNAKLFRVPKTGGSPQLVGDLAESPTWLAISGGDVFYMPDCSSSDGSLGLGKISKPGVQATYPFAPVTDFPAGLAASGGTIYWAEETTGNHEIVRGADALSGVTTTVIPSTTSGSVSAFLVDQGKAYWGTSGGEIFAGVLGGGGPASSLSQPNGSISALAVAGGRVFVTTQGNASQCVRSFPLSDPTDIVVYNTLTLGVHVADIVADASLVYYFAGGAMYASHLGGGAMTKAADAPFGKLLRADATHLYYTDGDKVFRLAKP